MKGGWLGVIMLALVVAIGLWANPAWRASDAPSTGGTPVIHASTTSTPVAPVATPLARPAPASTSPPDTFSAPRWIAANIAILAWLLALAILPLGALLGIALHARYRSRLIVLDRPPLRDREAIGLAYSWKHAEATAAGGSLQSLSYSPRYSNKVEGATAGMLPPVRVLSLPEVLGNPDLVIGSSHEGPVVIEGEWTSVGVGGQSGSGKSSTIASLVAQHAARGSRIFVADPHAKAQRRSLSSYLAPLAGRIEDMASDQLAILRMAERVYRELEVRKRFGHVERPAVLVVDEWLSLILGKDGQALADFLVRLVVEGQKSDMTVILAAQNWMAASAGGSILRNPLPVTVAHRMRASDMRALTGTVGDVPNDILTLPAGTAYASGPWGVSKVVVPHVRPEDLAPIPLPEHFPKLEVVTNGGAPEVAGKRGGSASTALSEALVIRLLREGHSIGAIVRQLTGERGGRAFQQAHDEVLAIIRRQLPPEKEGDR